MEIIDQKILHDSVRWPLSPLYEVRALPGEIKKEESAAGDIVIANEDGVKRIIKQSEYTTNSALYTEKGYQPIAVVVVPASHTDDGTARCMSLKFMTDISKTGSDYSYDGNLDWGGGVNDNLSNLPDLVLPIRFIIHGTTTESSWDGNSNSTVAASPSNCVYWGTNVASGTSLDPGAPLLRTLPAVSPYDTDGISKNPDLFIEGGITDYMDGKESTRLIIQNVNPNITQGSVTWLTDDRISVIRNTPGWYSAAMACYRYYTIGTNQTDWYLPSAGEAFYLIPRNKEIVDSLALCGVSTNDSSGLYSRLNGTDSFTTSTELNSTNNCYVFISPGGGNAVKASKNTTSRTVAFIKI